MASEARVIKKATAGGMDHCEVYVRTTSTTALRKVADVYMVHDVAANLSADDNAAVDVVNFEDLLGLDYDAVTTVT